MWKYYFQRYPGLLPSHTVSNVCSLCVYILVSNLMLSSRSIESNIQWFIWPILIIYFRMRWLMLWKCQFYSTHCEKVLTTSWHENICTADVYICDLMNAILCVYLQISLISPSFIYENSSHPISESKQNCIVLLNMHIP